MNNAAGDWARALARVLSGLAGLVALSGLLGYIGLAPRLIQLQPDFRGMSVLTAVALICMAAATLSASWRRERLGLAMAGIAAVTSLLTLACHAAFGADTLSPAVASVLFRLPDGQAGRMSVATGLGVLLLFFAAILRRKRPFLSDVASGSCLAISGVALLGYLYGVADLYALPLFNTMGLNTAVALAALALSDLLVEPKKGWVGVVASGGVGGAATRRQLAFITLPIVAGWLLLRSVDAAQIRPAAAMALLVVVTVLPLAILILRDGRALDDLEGARRERDEVQLRLTADMERRLREQAAQLEQESAERSKAEAVIYRAQRMEAVGQLTGGIAHDFNNLLMAIRGNLELIQRRLSSEDGKLARFLDNAIAATDKGAKVTSRLLTFSRSQKLHLRPVEIDVVLNRVREMIGTSLGPKIDIVLELSASGAWSATDPDQLELAILNLATNARDAMPSGGTLRIQSEVSLARGRNLLDEDSFVAVRVIDDGSGMPEEVAARAVEPFYTTKERDKGTGLGLAQVYGFVRQSGGDLRIVSAPGAGTSVEILLRQTDPPQEVVEPEPRRSTTSAPDETFGRRVLVVDDDDAVRATIVEALRASGFQVLEANDGSSALAILRAAAPVAAAVIDFLMPGMNGSEVARRAQLLRPGLPIVFVSGYAETSALEGISGAVVLRKPFDWTALDRALKSVMTEAA